MSQSDLIKTIDGRRFVWKDRGGKLHYGEGADIHPGVRLLWTACGSGDIPANASWLQRADDIVNCSLCLKREIP